MKQFLLKALKFFLIIALFLLAISLIFGLILWLDWPWWVGLFILVGLCGLWIGLIFVKKIMLRRREQNFVSQVIDQDESYIQTLGTDKKDSAIELQQRWKDAMGALRKSHLKKQGNPLYVLPWYLVIGESGSGKTTAIESAHLSSPFAEVPVPPEYPAPATVTGGFLNRLSSSILPEDMPSRWMTDKIRMNGKNFKPAH